MSFAVRLLRILLVLALVASGPGMAAPMAAMPASPHGIAAHHGCHGHAGMAHTDAGKSDGMRGHAHHPAHCNPADCHCACSHLLPAMTVAADVVAVALHDALDRSPPAQARPDPAQRHLIRPPIA